MDIHEDNDFVSHIACDSCGSKDNAALYTDGHSYCFGCGDRVAGDAERVSVVPSKAKASQPLLEGDYRPLRKRMLTEETCRKFGYMTGKNSQGQPVQIATYRDSAGRPAAQKLRTKDKNFSIVGDASSMTLFGSHLWSKGKKIVVCEGEIDAMSVSQIQGHRWATVSVTGGAQSAKKCLLKSLDYLSNFEEIVLMFDADEAGQSAAVACAEALPLGKVKIATMPEGFKDPNEALLGDESAALIDAIFGASDYRPDGIVSAKDLRDIVGEADAKAEIEYPYSKLNDLLMGIRTSSLITIAAGSGVGKSTLVREFAYAIHMSGKAGPVGMMMLEETTKRSLQGLVGLHMNKNITVDPDCATREEIEKQQVYFFDHFGGSDLQVLSNRIRYMNKGLGCKVIFLDHISLLISAATGGVTDERRLIDQIMNDLRVLVQELDIALFVVSHLRRPQSEAGHEGGAKVQLSQLRGSHAIAQLADACIGLEVDAEDPTAGLRNLVVLKNRHTGAVGYAGSLRYDMASGRLSEVDAEFDSDVPF
jgi:twinkle protein